MKEIKQQLAEAKSELVKGLEVFDQVFDNEKLEARLEALKEAKNSIANIDCEDQGVRTLKKALITIDSLIAQTENDLGHL